MSKKHKRTKLEKRRRKLAKLVEALNGYTDDASHVLDLSDSLTMNDRFLLVERSTRDDRFWLTSHATVEDAGRYHMSDEYMEDWSIEVVIEIDTGEEFDVELEPHAKKRVPA